MRLPRISAALRWRTSLTAIAIVCTGCFGSSDPPVEQLGEQYEIFQGIRVAAAVLKDGNKRLDVYIGVGVPIEGVHPDVLYCVGLNREKDPLVEAHALINAAPGDQPLFLYGRRVEGKYRQWWAGLDCVFEAVGVYDSAKREHITIDTSFGRPIKDLWSWRRFMKTVLGWSEKAAKEALPLP